MPLLFSYGTLQQESVQLSTFGRRLQGQKDELLGFEPSRVRIEGPQVVATAGQTHHANVTFNGRDDSRVSGTVFEISDAELAAADQYERLAAYERIAAMLASGRQTWVYVDARSARVSRGMSVSENKATVERYLEGFRKSDHALILSCLTEDVEWEMPGAFHLVGKLAFDKEIENDAFVGSPTITTTRMIEERDVVVVEGRVRATRRDGGVLHAVFCDVFVMTDARIRRLTTYLAEVT